MENYDETKYVTFYSNPKVINESDIDNISKSIYYIHSHVIILYLVKKNIFVVTVYKILAKKKY